jgi:hypothetical protein
VNPFDVEFLQRALSTLLFRQSSAVSLESEDRFLMARHSLRGCSFSRLLVG